MFRKLHNNLKLFVDVAQKSNVTMEFDAIRPKPRQIWLLNIYVKAYHVEHNNN